MGVEDNNTQATREIITITSEAQAWELLRHAVQGGQLPDNLSLVFDGWPSFKLKVSGRDWHGTVPTRIMSPLLEVQRDLHRAYAQVCYGYPNLRRLTEDDRDALELVVKVNEGSSDFVAKLWEQLNELSKKAVERMDSRDVVISVLGIALVIGGVEVGKEWIAARQAEKSAEQTVALSREETARLKIFADAVKQQPALKETRNDFVASQNRILKATKPTDIVVTQGVTLQGYEAKEIAQEERARSTNIEITGTFRVLANDASKSAGFRVKVARIEDGQTFTAEVPLGLDIDQQKLIQRAEWSKGAILVRLDMQADFLRGKIVNASVVRATAVD